MYKLTRVVRPSVKLISEKFRQIEKFVYNGKKTSLRAIKQQLTENIDENIELH